MKSVPVVGNDESLRFQIREGMHSSFVAVRGVLPSIDFFVRENRLRNHACDLPEAICLMGSLVSKKDCNNDAPNSIGLKGSEMRPTKEFCWQFT